MVEVGIKRVEVNGVAERAKLQKMIAEELNYLDEFFDTVIGISILHHIERRLKNGFPLSFYVFCQIFERFSEEIFNFVFKNSIFFTIG